MGLLPTILVDLCQRAGLASSEVDVSAVTLANLGPISPPAGYLIERPMTAVAALQEVMRAFFIDAQETGGKVRFMPRFAQASVMSVPESDLGLRSDNAELSEQFAQEQDLPISVTTMYYDATLDYQQGKQLKARNPRIATVATRNQMINSLPFVLTPDAARQVAETTLHVAWGNRLAYSVNLWRAIYMLLDAGDFFTFTYEGAALTARIVTTNLGQGCVVGVDAVSEDHHNYTSTARGAYRTPTPRAGAAPSGGSDVRPAADATLWLLDVPLLRDVDYNVPGSGFYYAMSSASEWWTGAILFQSSDDAAFQNIGQVTIPASFGRTLSVLGPPRSPWSWDMDNAVTVRMSVGALAGDTDLNVLNGTSNALLVGGEVIQYTNVDENADGSFTLSRLLRGRRGTERACATHTSGDDVIALLGGGLGRYAAPIGLVGRARFYRPVSIGGDLSTVPSQSFTLAGRDLMPYAPAGVGGYTDAHGNIVITWVRCTRVGGAWQDGTGTVPLSEGSEAYDVDVLDAGGAVLRTLSVTTPTAVYELGDQTADFGTAPASVSVRVYQKSTTVGRGFPAAGTAPTPGAWPTPWPAVFPPDTGGGFLVNGT
jgi:Putative phage tail protein